MLILRLIKSSSVLSLSRPFHSDLLLSHLSGTTQETLRHHNQVHGTFRTVFTPQTSIDTATPYHLYEPIEAVESSERYSAGGYHPVAIGDRFQDRYRVVHKLGHGGYSTIWLTKDEQSDRYVAVKVCTADSNSPEFEIISKLSSSQRSLSTNLGRSMITSASDRFNIKGPNGKHSCHVMNPARTSLSEAKEGSYNRRFQLETARALAAQLVIAVDYVHSQGIIHGDIHYGNVLLQLPFDLNSISEEQLYKEYGEPELEAIRRFDEKPLPIGIPTHAVVPIWLGKASDDLTPSEAKILLSDFGEAFSPTQRNKYESHTPLANRPPEFRFEPHMPLSFSSDIWSLGCCTWNIIAQRPLFENFLATEDDIICEQVDALGILPPDWWDRWEERDNRFTEDGKPINRNPFRSWEDRFEDSVQKPRQAAGMSPIDQAERDAFFSMLRSMLSFRPESRPTAKQLLSFEWMAKWALPEYHKIRNT
ncbi:hypothetical protein N7517_006535 [Penicillium concentricum]|uniref:non-specific serine/threonine protein kinase n=1 Tax=Penicillium concentricum TaxID=293559 RepID=A0A9W9VBF4_9EURO|nr:uncharacterized protein N7517_006535 [Penicillium concentricum]KAJ5374529.1 hypothetical protein N7517_006535 [Penicillium concentricum]